MLWAKDGVIYAALGLFDTVEGMQFDKGYVSAYFVTDNDRMEAVLKDPYILITDQKISNVQDIMPVLEAVSRAGKSLLIIAEGHRGRGTAYARAQQDPRRAQRVRCEGSWLRRPS